MLRASRISKGLSPSALCRFIPALSGRPPSLCYETWVFAELSKWKQLQAQKPELYFYRTAASLEVDFLLAGARGLIPVETKSAARVGSGKRLTLYA